ncbi:hypothetical protein PPL_08982 [Heterostelium album PN500]|uniref:Protein SYS1 homolog n=1 Tax=Heterostelium pallidum (strain ATCC 26659 / Pp 5 / PN500) TaxID=670386 RepID=D3BKA1_HETP5|nr:hypothetical protein PPL_08982 [Heterostelium album PN500]EFA78331.1 hypothetical protein PPL_08982 [Heterostelium album PN500]|eukprot:XP_020430456.1 hypothetical protein PPL_08982 [Heterostelium album PN500]
MFYKYAWDPKLIVGQIISVQCVYYMFLAVSLYVLDSIFLDALSLDQIFSYQSTNVHSQHGWVVTISFLLNSLFGSVCLRYIVERSKKCLDHAATVTFIHFVFVWSFSGFPKTASWWIVQIIGMFIMAILGEYLCMRKEMMDIPLSRAKELDSTPILLRPPVAQLSPPSPSFNTETSPILSDSTSSIVLEDFDGDENNKLRASQISITDSLDFYCFRSQI